MTDYGIIIRQQISDWHMSIISDVDSPGRNRYLLEKECVQVVDVTDLYAENVLQYMQGFC